jgi:hypothetical protein
MTRLIQSFVVVLLAALPFMAEAGELKKAYSVDQLRCLTAIEKTEHVAKLPPKLLRAIGMVETGRVDPQTGTAAPWPWSINVAGTDHVFATKRDAIAAVKAARSAGVQSIDVGCMQINMLHHPNAFASLDEAFDPEANVAYASTFLWRLHGDLGSWPAAAAAYHSMTPSLANAYVARVAVFWTPAAGFAMRGGALSPTLELGRVDPYGVMTPELKARALRAALDHDAHSNRSAALRQPASIIEKTIARRRANVEPIRPSREAGFASTAVQRW